jgi:effector-binding domain-containing protein
LDYKIEVRRLKPQVVVAIRRRTTPDRVAETLRHIYSAIGSLLARRQIEAAGPPFTRYHVFEGQDVDVECGLLIRKPLDGEGDIYCGDLPGGLAAVTTHVGDYGGLRAAHDAVRSWIERSGKQPEVGSWEVYRTDPSTTPDPKGWKTDVFCLIHR